MAVRNYRMRISPVTVPADFMGMGVITYPAYGTNPVGIINYKSARMMFLTGSKWFEIETSAGVYSSAALTLLDNLITARRQDGASVVFGCYGTPTFYAQTAANPTVGDNVTLGPSNQLGECSYPTSLAALTNFVNLIISRYNLVGGAWYDIYGATLGKGIQRWELGNEPPMDGTGNRATAPGQTINGTGFWGTDGQLIDYMQCQYSAIKALDPSIIVLSPGLINHPLSGDFAKCFQTTGPVYGKTGAQSCDVLAWHPYIVGPPGTLFATWPYIVTGFGDMISSEIGAFKARRFLSKNGYSHGMEITEWGYDTSSGAVNCVAWLAQSANFRYTWIARTIMCAAAAGVGCFHPFHFGITGADVIAGDYQNDIEGARKAYNDCAAVLPGKTILSGSYQVNGPVALNFSDGRSFRI